MSFYHSVAKSAFWLSIAAIAACGGGTSDPTPEETYTADIQIDVLDNGVEIKAPSVFFEGEKVQIQFPNAPYTLHITSEHLLTNSPSTISTELVEVVPQLTGTGDAEQVTTRMVFNIGKPDQFEHQGWSRPVYQYPIELGDPLTLRSGDDLTISANLSDAFLDREKDDFESFIWKQLEGPSITPLDVDNASLSLTLPNAAEITRLRFQLTAKTIQGKLFRKEKIVFVVPETAWVAATHIEQGLNNAVLAREDGSIVHFSLDGELTYSGSPFNNLQQLEDGTPLWALAETGELKWFSTDKGWLSPLQDLPAMTKLFGVFGDARSGTQMIDQNGNAHLISPNDHSSSIHGNQALSVSHRYINEHTLLESGELVDSADMKIADNIAEIAHYAFRSGDGRVGIYSLDGQMYFLSEFDTYTDFVAIAAPKSAGVRMPMPVFALRDNGEVIGSTPKSPPVPTDLAEIRKIEVGGKLATALKQDGTVIQWRAAILTPNEANAVLRGEKPSPFNIKETYY